MKKIWSSIVKDLWILLLDVIAVNGSYLLAIFIRFHSLTRKILKNQLVFA